MNLGALFYPREDLDGDEIPFDSLFIPYIYREIYFEGIYIDVLNQRYDMTIVDVGANIGVTAQHFKDHAKRLIAVEPSPEHFAALKKNKEYNGWDNVELCNYAIADKDGEMLLSVNKANRTCNSLVVGNGQGHTVKTVAFDTFFKENKLEEIDFMKFDVEGAEDLILRSDGFKKVTDKIKTMVIEFHHPNWTELAQYLIDLGYQARRFKSSAIVVLFTR
jgi:FkbM family methyltransferase